MPRIERYTLLLLLLSILLAACHGETGQSSPAPTLTMPARPMDGAAQNDPTSTLPAPPTSTPLPPLAVLLAPPGSDANLEAALKLGLEPALTKAGFRWEARSSLRPEEATPDLRLVVVIPPDPGLAELAALAPQTQFLAVGLTGFQPGGNLSLIGPTGFRPDRAGFIAGLTAAVLTPDWRVGVLGPDDSPASLAVRNGFLNGAAYFCGLCLPYHGPNVDYPIALGLSSGAAAAEIESAIQQLQNLAVKTVYLTPDVTEASVIEALAQAGFNIIGSFTAPSEFSENWVASVAPDPVPAALDLLPSLLAGEGGLSREMPYTLTEVNQDLLSAGREASLQELIRDLITGYIDTGVDPLTGETR